jgi:phospholipase/lecithinase/hemolysin
MASLGSSISNLAKRVVGDGGNLAGKIGNSVSDDVGQAVGGGVNLAVKIGSLVPGSSNPPPAPPGAAYPAIYAFGDSLTDAGNDYAITANRIPISPPYSDGRFTDGNVWVQDLATNLGLPALTPSLKGGTDFAYGGADTGATPDHTENPLDLPSQLQQFQQQDPHPASGALYAVWAGSNDVRDALSAGGNEVQSIDAAVTNEMTFLNGLYADGARNILVCNVPDIGKAPAASTDAAQAADLSAAYNAALTSDLSSFALSHPDAHLTEVNTFALLDQAAADPAAFGFTNVTQPLWSGNYTDPNSGTLATADPQGQAGYLFFDGLHPTAQTHAILAAAAQQALGGPAA